MYYTYILKSQKDNGYYFGFTSNINLRLKKHNQGKVFSTKSRRPFIIHYFETFVSKSEAWHREKYFKSFEGRKWLIANKILL